MAVSITQGQIIGLIDVTMMAQQSLTEETFDLDTAYYLEAIMVYAESIGVRTPSTVDTLKFKQYLETLGSGFDSFPDIFMGHLHSISRGSGFRIWDDLFTLFLQANENHKGDSQQRGVTYHAHAKARFLYAKLHISPYEHAVEFVNIVDQHRGHVDIVLALYEAHYRDNAFSWVAFSEEVDLIASNPPLSSGWL